MKNILGYEYVSNLCSVKKKIKNQKIKMLMEEFNFLPSYYFKFITKYHKDENEFENDEKLDSSIEEFLIFQFNKIKIKLISFYHENNINLREYYNYICSILNGVPTSEANFVKFIYIW